MRRPPLDPQGRAVDAPFTAPYARCAIFQGPVAHGAGRYVAPDGLPKLEEEGQVVLRHVDNPNGAMNDIAAVTNATRNVVGMMPHPAARGLGARRRSMKRPMMVVLSALIVGLGGCDKLPKIPFLSKKAPAATNTTTKVAQAPKLDTTKTAPAPTQTAPAPKPARTAPAVPLTDTPWTPVDTGTVSPGMTRDQVVAVWGVPVAERTQGDHTYLYFRNGCEVTCGTFDVVFLDDDKVVDAIVRGQGHTYSGVSSSPTARTPQEARPGAGPGD
jgi:hypothetical protein